jgi:translation initiation factor 3 subunit H
VNADHNNVGWYESTFLGSYCTRDTVLHQAEFQAGLPAAIMLVYDGARTAIGHLSLKALRLSDAFMEAYRTDKLSAVELLSSLAPSSVFEELPVRLRNPHLVQALLVNLLDGGVAATSAAPQAGAPAAAGRARAGGASASWGAAGLARGGERADAPTSDAATSAAGSVDQECDFSRLDLATAPFLEKHLDFLNELTDQLNKAQNDTAYMARRAAAQQRQRDEWIARRVRDSTRRVPHAVLRRALAARGSEGSTAALW